MTDEWQKKAKGIIKSELKRKHVGYKELVEKLDSIGIKDTEQNIANKLSRGSFTAAFFLQCLEAIGCHTIRLRDED